MKKMIFIGIIGLTINTFSAQNIRNIEKEPPRPLLLDIFDDYDQIEAKL